MTKNSREQVTSKCEGKVVRKFALEIKKLMHSLCPIDRANKLGNNSCSSDVPFRGPFCVYWGRICSQEIMQLRVCPIYRCLHGTNNHQSSTKWYWNNLPVGIKIVILPLKYWYLVDISTWENLCMPELLFGSILLFSTICMWGRFYLCMKVLACYLCLGNKTTDNYPSKMVSQKCEILLYRYSDGI